MADAAVEFLLENLKQLLLYHGHLIGSAKQQVEKLEEDLRLFRAFLRDTTKKRRKDDALQEVVRQIRDVVYEAEDIVDSFVTQAAENKSRNYFVRAFKTPVDLHSIARKVDAISKKVSAIYGGKTKIDFAIQRIEDGEHQHSEIPQVRRSNIVGVEDQAEMLKGYLREETEGFDVISIVGMPGLGKTTLAGKIFNDQGIKFEFPKRIWVYVSSEYTCKDVFLSILKELRFLPARLLQILKELGLPPSKLLEILSELGFSSSELKEIFNLESAKDLDAELADLVALNPIFNLESAEDPDAELAKLIASNPKEIFNLESAKDPDAELAKLIASNLKEIFIRGVAAELPDQKIAELVREGLEKSKKFLIVMDDVWTANDWDKLKIALPDDGSMGKVLITSRNEEVGLRANYNRDPHKLRLLTHDESCLLLSLEALGKREFPEELKVPGNLIAQQCGGLPLAVVVIGGILVKKRNARERAWERVSKSVCAYINEDPEKRMEKIISLSYDKLPYHLRVCFLYLGSMFPEDFEIPVWKLICMWIAEGFIQQKPHITMEETAENYLEEIISRNLVRIEKMSHDGRVKSCRIHDMLRDFCKNEAGNQRENFLQEIKKSSDGGFEPPVSEVEKHRRLCIHSNVINFLSSKPAPYGVRVRTFACFSNEEFQLPPENHSSIPAAFKLLRVLDVKPIRFSTRLPSDLYHLIHLKYFHMSSNLNRLPKSFQKLWNIQTLIIDTTMRTLEINADIWQMIHLRHLKTNASAILPETGKSSKGGEKLRTLGTILPESCTEEVFNRACNLKKLGIRGRLSSLLYGKNGSFDSLGKLGNLEKLKLLNDVFPSAPSEGQLNSLPPPYKFPPQLRSLTLSETFLNWSHMSILGLLEYLKVLKLKEKAFMGDLWQAANGGFRSLEVLHVGRTDLSYWKASGDQFPSLKRLEMHNCEQLLEIPIGLADIPTLQHLDLYHSSKSAAAPAKKIENAIKENRAHACGFKLSIFPPQE